MMHSSLYKKGGGLTLLVILLGVAFVLLIASPTVDAATETAVGDYNYQLDTPSTGEATLIGYLGSGGNIEIPSTITVDSNDYAVTAIGISAFANNKVITSVVIPSTVKYVRMQAFYRCSNMISVTFDGESELETVGHWSFEGCNGLTSITLPDSLKTLEESFLSCSGLTSVTIPAGVTSITCGFSGCVNLTEVLVAEGNTVYESRDGVLYKKDGTKLVVYPSGKTDITEYTVPNTVTEIDERTFYQNQHLEKLVIEGSVETLPIQSISYCSSLKEVYLPEETKYLRNSVFESCTELVYVSMPGAVTIGNKAFAGCAKLTNLQIPESATSIDTAAFDSSLCGYDSSNKPKRGDVVGHLYTGVGVFSEDLKKCTITLTCSRNSSHTLAVDVDTVIENDIATATLTYGGETYTYTADVPSNNTSNNTLLFVGMSCCSDHSRCRSIPVPQEAVILTIAFPAGRTPAVSFFILFHALCIEQAWGQSFFNCFISII